MVPIEINRIEVRPEGKIGENDIIVGGHSKLANLLTEAPKYRQTHGTIYIVVRKGKYEVWASRTPQD